MLSAILMISVSRRGHTQTERRTAYRQEGTVLADINL